MSAFDPTPDEPYGRCSTCSVILPTEAAANEHMTLTLAEAQERGEPSRSHSVRVTNPARPQRIRSRIATIVEDAVYEAMGDFDDLIERGELTEQELTDALRMHPDFADAWSERDES